MNKNVKLVSIIICLFVLIVSPFNSLKVEANSITPRISSIVKQVNAQGGVAGISVRDATDGKILYQYNGSTHLRPASNMKLITGAAALQVLGTDYRFSTEVLTNGKREGNAIVGNVYLRGKGDSSLLEKDLNELASKLKKMGITRIKGKLVADDTWYDNVRYSADLPLSDQQEYYGAAISALTLSPNSDYDAGTVIVQVTPGKKAGQAANVSLTPKNNYVKIHNQTKTSKSGSANTIKVTRKHGTNDIYITGNIPMKGSQTKEWIAVWEPTGYALELFRTAIQKQGIVIEGGKASGRTPTYATLLAVDQSEPLSNLLVPFMKVSNNTIGEVLVKEMGKVSGNEGSWDEGLRMMKEQMPSLGILSDKYTIRDGSGISHLNLISANALSSLLYAIQKEKWFPIYQSSLPVAGNSDRMVGGTLRNRMIGTAAAGRVMAKTGTISTVSTLSGYVHSKSGKKYIFSILLHHPKNSKNLKNIENQIAIALANS